MPALCEVQLIPPIMIHGKIKAQGSFPLNAKRVSARVQKIPNQQVGKVLHNALLYPGIKTSAQKNSLVAIFHTLDDGGNYDTAVACTFLIRTKSEKD